MPKTIRRRGPTGSVPKLSPDWLMSYRGVESKAHSSVSTPTLCVCGYISRVLLVVKAKEAGTGSRFGASSAGYAATSAGSQATLWELESQLLHLLAVPSWASSFIFLHFGFFNCQVGVTTAPSSPRVIVRTE